MGELSFPLSCRSFDGSKDAGHPVAEELYTQADAARTVLEKADVSFELKDDAFEKIKAAAFLLCWLCNTVQPAQGVLSNRAL